MNWNFFRISAVVLTLSACVQAEVPIAQVMNIPNTGQQITPLAPRGSRFTYLNPGLAAYPNHVVGQAVTDVASPDHKTLLVLTTGDYGIYNSSGSQDTAASTDWVFVYDITNPIPVQKQAIQVQNTYNGIVFDPSGTTFYVAGGRNDNVHIYTLTGGIWGEQTGSPISLGHTSQAGGTPPEAAGIAITQDGTKLVVTNYENDSISVLTKSGGVWSKTADFDLRPGEINPAQSGVPGGGYPFWVTIQGNSTAFVSCMRDREIDVLNIAGTTPTLTTRIKLKGQPLKSTLNAAQTTLYVAEDQTDSVAVINTSSNTVTEEVSVAAPSGIIPSARAALSGNNTNSVTLSPDGTTLYLTNGNTNNIAVVSVSLLNTSSPVLGLIPTGMYPNSVTFSGNGSYMYVVNGKSPTGPNPTHCHGNILPSLPSSGCAASNGYSLQLIIEQAQLRELPLNGRNWSSLTALSPGAIDNGPSDQRTIRFAGHGLDDNDFLFDGVDASGILNQAQKEYVRLAIPLDSIAEFEVQSQNFSASIGMTAGGQISVASPSGANTFHGGVFDYFRNDVLDSRSPFDGSSPNPFLLNQFGASLNGPIARNRTFFYANYEGLRQHLGQTQIGLTPSPQFVEQAAALSPALVPILAAYPRGTSPTSNPQVWNYVAGANQVDNEDSGMLRIDQHFTDRTTAFLRYSADEAVYSIPAGALNALADTDTRLKNGVVELLHVFSPALVCETKFGVNHDLYHTANISPVPFSVSVSNLSPLTASSTTDGDGTTFSYVDDTTWAKARHVLKLGIEIRRIDMNQGNSSSGTLTYLSLNNFMANSLDSATYTSLLPLKRLRKTQFYGYIEDQFKATPNLTFNMGLRYSFFNVFHEVDNRAIPFDLTTCGGYCASGSLFTNPRRADFDPRLGLAWARGQTVLRAGAGIYHSDGQEDDQNLPISNDVERYTLSAVATPGLRYPIDPFLQDATSIVTPRDLYRHRKDMYVAAWTASVQRALPWNMVGAASYFGNKGTNILTTTYVNTINPLNGVQPYPQFGVVSWRGNDSNSTFHALQLNARRAFQRGWLLAANYMWSHSINDDGIGGGESDTPQNVFCRACEKASSDDDVRQVFNVSSVYELPFGAGKPYLSKPGTLRAMLGGWQFSGIGTARTGLPVNVIVNRANSDLPDQFSVAGSERPDLVPGVSLTPPDGQTPNHWINPAAFVAPAPGTYGDAGRNLVRAPGLWQVDAALAKNISVTERIVLQCRVEAFNVFNRAQFGSPQANLSSPLNFGAITTPVNQGATGSGTPRQFQLALRLSF